MFSESEFYEACNELDSIDISGWNFFIESHGIKVYQQYNEVTGLYAYKVHGTMNGIEAQVLANTFSDLEYRKTWDPHVKDIKQAKEGDHKDIIYWEVNYPFPLSNRDYVCERMIRELDVNDHHVWVILYKITESSSFPPVDGVVRATDYFGSVAMRSDGQDCTDIVMKIYDNPGGLIPAWLINWVAQKGIPSFLDTLVKACNDYAEYVSSRSS